MREKESLNNCEEIKEINYLLKPKDIKLIIDNKINKEKFNKYQVLYKY